jgi:hypothetical protein
MAGTGIQSFAKFRAQILPRNANFRTAECQGLKTVAQYIGEWWLAFRSMFESGLPRSYSCCGNPRHLTADLPFYIDSSPVGYVINFCRATF